MTDLTSKQSRVLEFIRHYMATNGRPPTRAEIAEGLGFASANAAQTHLQALSRRGAIELVSGASRGIRLPATRETDPGTVSLPVVGRVAAGAPILAVENVESRQAVAEGLFSPRPDYLLRTRGDSMIEAGILDGDLLAVHATAEAPNGSIAVVRIEDEVTVKRLRHDGDRLILMPANPDYAPVEVDLRRQNAVIEGRAVGVVRRI